MKKPSPLSRGLRLAGLAILCLPVFSGVSCTTTYDPYGRPVQSVDPAVAVAGVAAAGLIGYAIADSRRGYGGHGGGYCPPPRPCHY